MTTTELSSARIAHRVGDTHPTVQETLMAGPTPIDLTGVTVTVHAWDRKTGTVFMSDRAVTVADATAGVVTWNPTTSDTATAREAEYEYDLDFGSGSKGTVPSKGRYRWDILPAIA